MEQLGRDQRQAAPGRAAGPDHRAALAHPGRRHLRVRLRLSPGTDRPPRRPGSSRLTAKTRADGRGRRTGQRGSVPVVREGLKGDHVCDYGFAAYCRSGNRLRQPPLSATPDGAQRRSGGQSRPARILGSAPSTGSGRTLGPGLNPISANLFMGEVGGALRSAASRRFRQRFGDVVPFVDRAGESEGRFDGPADLVEDEAELAPGAMGTATAPGRIPRGKRRGRDGPACRPAAPPEACRRARRGRSRRRAWAGGPAAPGT